MASEKNISFTTTVYTSDDWERNMGGWRCPALKIPSATVDAIFVSGQKVDDGKYQVLYNHSIIRWSDDTPPTQALISILLTQALLTQQQSNELSQKWRQLAIILPFIAAIVGSTATYLANKNKSTTSQKEIGTQPISSNKKSSIDTFNVMFPRGLRAVVMSNTLNGDSTAKENPSKYLINNGITLGRVNEGLKKAYAGLVQKSPEEIQFVPWIIDGKPVNIGYSFAIRNAGPIPSAKYKEVQLFQNDKYFTIYIHKAADGEPQGAVIEPTKSGINWTLVKDGLSEALEELYLQKKYVQFGNLGVYQEPGGSWEYRLEYELVDKKT